MALLRIEAPADGEDLLRQAVPLDDPVKSIATLVVVSATVMVLMTLAFQLPVLVFAFELSRAQSASAAGLIVLAGIVGPLTLRALLLPGRRNTALYLRAFRSDGTAAQVRSLIRVALGADYRLCGIRPPTERASWPSRVLLTVATALKYVGSESFELEADNHNWMPRLLASCRRSRLVFVDVRDLTAHVADEIRLAFAAMGADRCIFLTDGCKSDSAWREEMTRLACIGPEHGSQLLLLRFGGNSEEQQAFVRSASVLIRTLPQGLPDVSAAIDFVAAQVPAALWVTPLLSRASVQIVLGAVLLNILVLILNALTIHSVVFLWFLVAIAILVISFARAMAREWRDARSRARYQLTAGAVSPYVRPMVLLVLSIAGFPAYAMLGALPTLPRLVQIRNQANGVSAKASLRATMSAQVSFAASCGNGGYAASYETLGLPDPTDREPFISPDLGNSEHPEKSGYRFSIHAGLGSTPGPVDCHGRPTVTEWYASATPISSSPFGDLAFATNTSNRLWQREGMEPPSEPFDFPAYPVW